MPQDLEPFVKVEFDELLNGRAEEAAPPTSSATVRYWSADCASIGEEPE